MINKIKNFVKKETVLCISAVLALCSMILNPPCEEYVSFINFSTLATLFCLMITVQGFSETGLFRFMSVKLTGRLNNTRSLSLALVLLCFFMSMLITNDVALLTFVPLAIMLFINNPKTLMRCVILQTAGANLGSMLTPVGNPQNLYIFSYYEYDILSFLKVMLPVTAVSFMLILLSLFFIPSEEISTRNEKSEINFRFSRRTALYTAIFAISLCSVARLIDYRICFLATVVAVIIFDRKILRKPDYALLATFVCFFILVGNLSSVESLTNLIKKMLDGRELFVSCGLSQIISNVPCAVMLSGFTDQSESLLLGVNIGGLGTPIASLASLISYKLYARSENSNSAGYMAEFLVYNFAFLALLLAFATFVY